MTTPDRSTQPVHGGPPSAPELAAQTASQTSASPHAPAAKAAQTAAKVTRRWPLVSGLVAVLLVAGLGAIIAYREGNLPFEFDAEWMEEVVEHRNPFWEVPALVMNWIGGGLVGAAIVPVAIILIFCFFRRFSAAIYFAVATAGSAAIVQILKNIFDRPRPEDILVVADVGSFPSGHTANAATMAVVLGFILQRVWVWVAGVAYTVLMLLSRTYLGAHWLSDTIGGLVLGVAVAVIVWAPFAWRLQRERQSRPGTLFSRGY